jgi:hypothetical protein
VQRIPLRSGMGIPGGAILFQDLLGKSELLQPGSGQTIGRERSLVSRALRCVCVRKWTQNAVRNAQNTHQLNTTNHRS